jgi:hypothetical protein
MSDQHAFPRLRPSISHAASRQAEIDRVRRMTVEERVKAALGLAARFASLRPAPRNPDADRAAIRDLCRTWPLRGLDPLIAEAAGEA